MLVVVKLLLYKVLKHNLLSFKTRTIKIQCLLIEWKVYSKVRISIWTSFSMFEVVVILFYSVCSALIAVVV